MKRLAVFGLCLTVLSGCASLHEAMHPPKKVEDTQLYLTLLPRDQVALGKSTDIDTKLTQIKTRALITKEDLKPTPGDALPLLALDSSFTDFQAIFAKPTAVEGLYHFSFTPHVKSSYRIWSLAELKTAEAQEYPFKDIGIRTPGSFKHTEMLTQTQNGITYVLQLDSALKRFNETTFELQAKNANDTIMPATIKDITGVYDDYRTLIHLTPQNGKVTFVPDKQGFIKCFTRIETGGKESVVAFTVSVAKD